MGASSLRSGTRLLEVSANASSGSCNPTSLIPMPNVINRGLVASARGT